MKTELPIVQEELRDCGCATTCCSEESKAVQPTDEAIRTAVRDNYRTVALSGSSCGCSASSCGPTDQASLNEAAQLLGYSATELASLPEGTNLGLGCGNPGAIAALKQGETVLDLGSGAGIDCLLAAQKVGPTGRVIGIDMTAEMISRARANAVKAAAQNVEFRLGEIEHLPVADDSVDVIISNCVINLSPDKSQVFTDAFRVLKSGGRLAISDIVASAVIPTEVKNDLANHAACFAGAAPINDLTSMLAAAGFNDIKVEADESSRSFIRDWIPDIEANTWVVSARITAEKK